MPGHRTPHRWRFRRRPTPTRQGHIRSGAQRHERLGDAIRQQYGATTISVLEVAGQSWTRNDADEVELIGQELGLFVVELPEPDACPHTPHAWSGVPLAFVVGR